MKRTLLPILLLFIALNSGCRHHVVKAKGKIADAVWNKLQEAYQPHTIDSLTIADTTRITQKDALEEYIQTTKYQGEWGLAEMQFGKDSTKISALQFELFISNKQLERHQKEGTKQYIKNDLAEIQKDSAELLEITLSPDLKKHRENFARRQHCIDSLEQVLTTYDSVRKDYYKVFADFIREDGFRNRAFFILDKDMNVFCFLWQILNGSINRVKGI